MLPALPRRREIRIDVTSAVLACAGMAALIYGLGQAAAAGWGSAQVTGSLIAAVVLLGGLWPARRGGHRLLPLRVVLDRNRGWGMIALIVNAVSTFGMLLILTYQLQSVMGYSALATGLAIVPFGVATGIGAALLAPWLIARVPPRWLVSASIVIEAAGLVPLIWLTPSSRYLPLILAALLVEGLGTGIAGPTALNLALRGVLPSDAGAAGAATSAVGQLGSSVGAALLNTIAAAATSGYLAAHAGAVPVSAIVHGFAVAMAWARACSSWPRFRSHCSSGPAPVRRGHLRMFTARATTRATVTIDTLACAVMPILAQRDRGSTSVGLNAAALVKDRYR